MEHLPKRQIRKIFRGHLDKPISSENHHSLLSNLREQLLQYPPDAIIAAYYPIKNEINVLELLAELGRAYALPVIIANDASLEFRIVDKGTKMVEGKYFAIPEPDNTARIVLPDIVIVPLLAIDRAGHRVGYGKGFYDRTLQDVRAHNPDLVAIGVCYDFQLVTKLSREGHDQKLDIIITDREICKISTS